MPCMRGGGERIPHIVEMPSNTVMERGDYDQQAATYQLGNSTQEDTVKNATVQRNVGTLSCGIKCKWQNQVKKAELRVGEKRIENMYRIECCKKHG